MPVFDTERDPFALLSQSDTPPGRVPEKTGAIQAFDHVGHGRAGNARFGGEALSGDGAGVRPDPADGLDLILHRGREYGKLGLEVGLSVFFRGFIGPPVGDRRPGRRR